MHTPTSVFDCPKKYDEVMQLQYPDILVVILTRGWIDKCVQDFNDLTSRVYFCLISSYEDQAASDVDTSMFKSLPN